MLLRLETQVLDLCSKGLLLSTKCSWDLQTCSSTPRFATGWMIPEGAKVSAYQVQDPHQISDVIGSMRTMDRLPIMLAAVAL